MNLVKVIEDLLNAPSKCGSTRIIAIDGRAGAGKTTLAKELFLALSAHHEVSVIHLDEIYAGWDLALGQTLTDSLSQILESFSRNKIATFPIYDWVFGEFDSTREILPGNLIIIEGVGSAQRIVRDVAAATIWIDIDPHVGLRRVLERDGISIENQMKLWQMREEEHFLADATRESVDFILSTL